VARARARRPPPSSSGWAVSPRPVSALGNRPARGAGRSWPEHRRGGYGERSEVLKFAVGKLRRSPWRAPSESKVA